MIGQIYKTGEDFGLAFDYLNGTLEPVPSFTFCRNLPTDHVGAAEVIMDAFSRLSGRTRRHVYRFRVFFHSTDRVDPEMVRALVEEILKDLGADELQAVIGYVPGERHHLYAVVNRVRPDRGTVWAPFWDMLRMMSCLRRLEREHGLMEVITPRRIARGGERHPGGFRGPPDKSRRPRRASRTTVESD